MGLYDDILKHLEDRGLRFVKKFMPYFIASFGCHIIHIANLQFDKDHTPLSFFLEHGHSPDLRLHILFIAPSGFGKSTFLNHSLDEDYNGVFCEAIETYFKGLVTAAHLSGSAGIDKQGKPFEVEGFLEEHKEAIVGVEELSSMLISGKQEHSLEMGNLLLDWLRGGKIRKGVKGTSKAYTTKATLWAGSLLPHSPIITYNKNGIDVIPICDAVEGEQILTPFGWEKNKGVLSHYWNGEVIGLAAHGSYIDITPNHSLFKNDNTIIAGNLKIGDKIDFVDKIDLQKLLLNSQKYSDTEQTEAFIQGFWCAEGWFKRGWRYYYSKYDRSVNPQWMMSQKNRKTLEMVQNKIEEIYPNSTTDIKYYGDSGHYLYVKKPAGSLLFQSCLSKSWIKKVPQTILNNSELKVRNAFYDGFLLGDGYRAKHGNVVRDSFSQCTARSALSLGVTILNEKMRAVHLDNRFENGKGMMNFRVNATNRLKKPLNQIEKIFPYHYEGLVYDIATESGKFLTGVPNLIVAHNTQPGKERVELHGGMHGRFFFILWIPTLQDEMVLRDASFEGLNVPLDYSVLKNIRTRLQNLRERLVRLEGIYFTQDLIDYLKQFDHNYINILKRLAIGYAVMKEDFDKDLKVGLDDELKRLINESVEWRTRIFREISSETGLGTDLLMMVLKRNVDKDNKIEFTDLADKMMLLGGESYSDTHDYLRVLKMSDPPRVKVFHEKDSNKVWVMPLE